MSGDFAFADGLSALFSHRSSDHSDIDDFRGIVDDPLMNFAHYLHSSVDYGQLTDRASSTDRALFSAPGGSGKVGGTTPVTPNSSLSWSSIEAAAGEVEDKQLAEDDQDEDGVDKSKKVNNKARKKGEKRQREPCFAFMTKSEVDHLEDGYRWRKYGQKAVKNSPYPRSYYRCTTQKCMVKKRVERSFKNPSIVITTYEGQHTHQIPTTARGSPHTPPPPQVMPPSFGLLRQDLLMQQYVLNNSQIIQARAMNPNIYMPSPLHQHHQQQLQFPDQYGLLQDIVLSSNPNQP